MIYRVLGLVKKELIQFSRDRFLVLLVMVGPLVMLLLIGFGTANPVVNISTAVLDLDQSQHSRQLVQVLDNTEEFDIEYYCSGGDEVDSLLDRGEVSVALIIPNGFATGLAAPNRQAQLQVILDGSQVTVTQEALGTAQTAVVAFEQSILVSAQGGSMPIETTVRTWFNPSQSRATGLLPWQMGMMLVFVVLAIPAWSIAREKERGTLEQLLMSPIRTSEFFIGKAIPAVLVAFTVFLLMLAIVTFVFHVPLSGSLAAILGFSLFFILVELGLGITISVFSRTQMQALVVVFVLMMLHNVLSGHIIPIESMPTWVQWLCNLDPLKHALIIFRGTMLKGSSLGAFPTEMIALVLLGAAFWTIALVNLRRRSVV